MSSVSQPVEKASVQIRTNEYLYEFEPDKLEFESGVGGGIGFKGWSWGMTVTKREEEMSYCGTPELTLEDLQTIQKALIYLEELAGIRGMHAVEIRMKTEDPTYWTVLGYGESGDPCVLRFEKDK